MESLALMALTQSNYLANNIPQLLYTTTLGVAGTVTYTVVTPYNRIWCVWYARCTAAATSENFQVQLNADSASHYVWQDIQGVNSTSSAGSSGAATTSIAMGNVTSASATANYYSSGSFIVDGANQGSSFPTITGTAAAFLSASSSIAGTYSGQYNVAGQVTSVLVFPASGNFTIGSIFSFYGLV